MIKNILFIEYDLIGAFDPFGKEMIFNLSERNIILAGYEELPDEESHVKRYLETGYSYSEVYNVLDYYNHYIDKNLKKHIESLELMDEFEEFNLLMSHSSIGYGLKIENSEYDNIKDLIKIKNN